MPRYIAAKPVGQVAGQFADVPFPVVHSLAPVAEPPSQHPDCVGTAPIVWANALLEINTVPVTTAATMPARNGLIPFNIAPEAPTLKPPTSRRARPLVPSTHWWHTLSNHRWNTAPAGLLLP